MNDYVSSDLRPARMDTGVMRGLEAMARAGGAKLCLRAADHHIRITREVRVGGTMESALTRARGRLILVVAVFMLCFAGVAGRLAQVTLAPTHNAHASLPAAVDGTAPTRGTITDRAGRILATSITTWSLHADPKIVLDARDAAAKLARTLPELDEAELLRRLSSPRRFVWLKRHLTPEQVLAVNALGLPGLDFREEEKRIWPAGHLAAHLTGYTGIDSDGLAGIELGRTDALARGEDVTLTIDLGLQHIIREELARTIERFDAIAATGIVMDVRDGSVLGMVSLPDFDPHNPAAAPAEAKFNRATLGVYELGSTFKIFTHAVALESGRVSMDDVFDTTRPMRAGRFLIRDYHPQDHPMGVADIFRHSSNIGTVQMALAVGTERFRGFLDALGLTRAPDMDLPETGSPLLPEPWREVNTMTASYGHGIAVSPVQLAAAVAAMVNGGIYNPPRLVAEAVGDTTGAPPGMRVISEGTSAMIRRLMRTTVMQGTGRNAAVEGYVMGGKTGTAEKISATGYDTDALISSFVGTFPMHDPQYLVYVVVDEPKPQEDTFGYATGGWVAAPAVAAIARRMGPLMGLEPVDETAPGLQELLALGTTPEGAEVKRIEPSFMRERRGRPVAGGTGPGAVTGAELASF